MAARIETDEDFGLSSDDESAMIAFLDDQNSGNKRKSSSHNNPPAKRLATAPIFQCAVSNYVPHLGYFCLGLYLNYVTARC